MPTVGVIVHTLVSLFLLLCIMVVYFIPFLIMWLLPTRWLRNSRIFYWLMYSFYWILIKCSFLSIKITGEENLPKEPAIIVANHQSALDIPIVGSLLGADPQIWLATTFLKQSLIFRTVLPKFVVWVDMSTPLKGVRSLVKVIKTVKETDQHIVIFPEGARFVDEKVHDFFAGFAILARKTGRPVVPVRLFNLYKVYPPNIFWIHRHPVRVVIGKPFYVKEGESNEHFRDRVHSWFVEQK